MALRFVLKSSLRNCRFSLLWWVIGVQAFFLFIMTAPFAADWSRYQSSVIIEVTRGNFVSFCSGVAISPKVLLTAAHCVNGAHQIRVAHDWTYHEESPHWGEVDIEKSQIHPQYDYRKSNYRHDLAVLRVAHALPNAPAYFPQIGLSPLSQFPDFTLSRIGYGQREEKNTRTWTDPLLVEESQRGFFELEDHHALPGDSGGPIFLENAWGQYLVGIHSTFQSPLKTFAVKLADEWDWIRGHLLSAGEVFETRLAFRTSTLRGGSFQDQMDFSACRELLLTSSRQRGTPGSLRVQPL